MKLQTVNNPGLLLIDLEKALAAGSLIKENSVDKLKPATKGQYYKEVTELLMDRDGNIKYSVTVFKKRLKNDTLFIKIVDGGISL